MNRPVTFALKARADLRPKSQKIEKEATVTFYCEAVSYLLDTYAKNHVTAEKDAYMIPFTPPSNRLRTKYSVIKKKESHFLFVSLSNSLFFSFNF